MKNLSVTKIEKFLQCPLSFKYRYVDKIPEQSSYVLQAGQTVHEIIENALKVFGRTGKYPDWQAMDDQFEPTWAGKVKKEESKENFVGWNIDPEDPPEKMKEEYRPLIRLAREEALPKLRPMMVEDGPVVEYRVNMSFKSDVGPFDILGYIDLLDDTGMLSDWKSTKKVSARAKKGWLQSASYSFFVYPMVGEEEVRAQKIFLVREPGNPHIEYAPLTVGRAHRAWFANLSAQIWKSIYYGVYPAHNEHWSCNPKFCSFYGPCQEGIVYPEEEEKKDVSGEGKNNGGAAS